MIHELLNAVVLDLDTELVNGLAKVLHNGALVDHHIQYRLSSWTVL
jgi:thioester reductase-like protein